MDATREAEWLVELWQELQAAQVAGDVRRLAGLSALAASQAERPGTSEEWRLLAREAGRHAGLLHGQVDSQPTAGVGAQVETGEIVLDEVSVPDAAREPAEERSSGRGRGLGGLIWVVILVGYLLLQLIGGLGGGDSP